jgi:dephospho-CoA kinase
MQDKKIIIGLCGGIGSGKSTVAPEFQKLGCAVIDADQISHQVIDLKEVKDFLVQWWGPAVLDSQGQINRKAVAEIVFADEGKLKKLTNLLHPLIVEREKALIDNYNENNKIRVIVLDVPLLIETGQNLWCDFLVFIDAEEQTRYERIVKNRGWDEKQIKIVEKLQLPLDSKAEISDYRVDNNSGIPGVVAQIATILSRVLGSEPDK